MLFRIFTVCTLALTLQHFVLALECEASEIAVSQALLSGSELHRMVQPEPQATIREHYGNPDNFMKYIIQKPPVYV